VSLPKPVRPSVKAIIVQDGKLLTLSARDATGREFFVLPGGGQEPLETVHEALNRECLEEIGVTVRVGALLYVRDYIAKNHEFAAENPLLHALELMFECSLEPGAQPRMGSVPDDLQTGVAWLPLEELPQLPLYPKVLRGLIARGDRSCVYLGDVN
jgi:ADP-ribose pyrophosphatase YjhB (NUDIX family)